MSEMQKLQPQILPDACQDGCSGASGNRLEVMSHRAAGTPPVPGRRRLRPATRLPGLLRKGFHVLRCAHQVAWLPKGRPPDARGPQRDKEAASTHAGDTLQRQSRQPLGISSDVGAWHRARSGSQRAEVCCGSRSRVAPCRHVWALCVLLLAQM